MNSKSNGFTLIELVVVITILGILAAIALPRYAALQTQARIAKMNGAAGAMKAAAALTHATQLTSNLAPGASVTMEGQVISMVNGYPCADRIAVAAGVTAQDYVLGVAAGNCSGTGTITIAADAGHSGPPSNCVVTYTEAPVLAGVTGQPFVDAPTNVTVSNCT